jgi:hypothetical protein
MTKRTNSNALPEAIFSQPLAKGSYPFSLSQEEENLSLDDWAWLFLRLNPLYQHDYALRKNRAEHWKNVPSHFRGQGPVVFPQLSDVVIYAGEQDPSRTSLHAAIAQLDSRYFTVDGEPLGSMSDKWAYEPVTLAEYIARSSTEVVLEQIRIRDFDAARDFGIGVWLDPAQKTLPDLPTHKEVVSPSWFHHVNEPIWEAGSWAFMRPEVRTMTLADGQKLEFGRRETARERTSWTQYQMIEGKPEPGETIEVKIGEPLPVTSSKLTGTQFQFLVCLDGYVRPQLATAFRLAKEFQALHKKYHPQSVQRGAPAKSVDLDELPNASGRGMNLFSQLKSGAVRQRKNWRAVTIDVAAALGQQQDEIEKELIWQQKSLGDTLTFPIRKRARDEGETKNDARKRALCLLELHLFGSEEGYLSQVRMNSAIYCSDTPAYHEIRGLSIPEHVTQPDTGIKQEEGYLDRIREGLDFGKQLALGWYEFEASLQFDEQYLRKIAKRQAAELAVESPK